MWVVPLEVMCVCGYEKQSLPAQLWIYFSSPMKLKRAFSLPVVGKVLMLLIQFVLPSVYAVLVELIGILGKIKEPKVQMMLIQFMLS